MAARSPFSEIKIPNVVASCTRAGPNLHEIRQTKSSMINRPIWKISGLHDDKKLNLEFISINPAPP